MTAHDRQSTVTKEKRPLLTRRSVLRAAGCTIAAAALPTKTQASPQSETVTDPHAVSAVMTRLSEYMSEARNAVLPEQVVEQVKWHILDTFAAIVSGSELPPGRAAIAFARAYGGEKVATIACSDVLCGPIEAALVNGVLAHADETDDSWPGGWHPGCNVVPAALAVGERAGVSGTHLLRAVALGYDIGARMLITLRPGFADSHKATHSIAGVFGAAAAAGCAAGLNPQQMRWLIDYTAQQCSGISYWYRDSDHIEKGFVFGGMPARSGVTSALLVQAGWTGVPDALSGRDNFLLAHAPTTDSKLLVDELGKRYEVVRTSIKKWTVGTPIQAPLDAMEALLKRERIDPEQVQEVLVRSAPGSVVDNSDPPDINIQYAMALFLIDKGATFRSIHDTARMQDPAIRRLRSKVRLEAPAAPGASSRGSAKLPLVEITLEGGRRVSQDVGPVLGTAENPMTRQQLVTKCRELMIPVLNASRSARLIDKVLALEGTKDIRELRPLLQNKP
jgi:2-methylcitrate dehydratase PrpD